MKRTHAIVFSLALSISWWPRPALADATDHVVISELQTGTTASSSQEFIELYNPTDQPIVLDGWLVQYHPAGATSSWTTRTSGGLLGSIPAQGYFLLSTTNYLTGADGAVTSGMAASGGSVQLVDNTGNVIDLLGWGTAIEFEAAPAPLPAADGSLERLAGQTNPNAGNGIDSDSNLDDFIARLTAEPQPSSSPTEIPGEALQQTALSTETPETPATPEVNETPSETQPVASLPIMINELLIDPVSPKTDAKDEYIELYNPNPTAVNLTGYTLKTGKNFSDKYSLPSLVIPPGGYLPLYSLQTKLALTNGGGAAELVDVSGSVIDQTAEYDGSMAGLSFSRFGDDWQWTQTLTPGNANQFSAPPTTEKAASTAAKTPIAKKAAAKKTTAKTTASKIKTPKAVKAAKAKTLVAAEQQKAGLGAKWLIIGLATLTLGYAIYEFRYDLQNYYVLAKRNIATRRQTRAAARRRRDH